MPIVQSILTDQTTDENGDIPMNRMKENNPGTDLESVYTKLFKNQKENRQSFYIVLTLLITILVAFVFVTIGLSLTIHTKANQKSKLCTTEDCLRSDHTKANEDSTICTTEVCLRSATSLVEAMDSSVDPCEDFYEFACGRYGNTHRIPKSSYSNDRFIELRAEMLTSIRDFMEKEDSDTDPYSVTQSRLLYRSCMATGEMEAAGQKNLIQILDEIGLPPFGFTINSNDEGKNLSLSTILASIKKQINLDILFTTYIEADSKNQTIRRISLRKPSGSNVFPNHKITENMRKMSSRKIREILASEETVEDEEAKNETIKYLRSFQKYVISIWQEIFKFQSNNSNVPIKILESNAAEIVKFMMVLKEIKDHVYETDGQLPLIMNVDELQLYTDNVTYEYNFRSYNVSTIEWKEYFTILFEDVENVTLDFETDLIQIYDIEYFKILFEVLTDDTESERVLHTWWAVVNTLLPYTTNQMRFLQDTFFYESTGLEINPIRSLFCANAVNNMMGFAVSRLLLDIDSLDHNIKIVMDMMDNIHWSFEKIVNDLKWMDDTTKNRILNKAKQIETFVGYPEFIKDQMLLDEYYYNISYMPDIVKDDFLGNVIRYLQRDVIYSLISLRSGKDLNLNPWPSNPLAVNAYYRIHSNIITIPAGILQFPFFGHDLQVLNYGYLGTVLGHELTHGFDNTGRKYDQDGNEIMWWTNQTINEYEKRSKCFIDHYESQLVPGVTEKINGQLTLDENIADNGGIREALWAYRKFVSDYGEEQKLPGLEEYSNEQIFFLAFANSLCESTTNESILRSLLDEHSPNNVRIVAGLINSEEFSDVWKCKKGSRMNPPNDKCKIW